MVNTRSQLAAMANAEETHNRLQALETAIADSDEIRNRLHAMETTLQTLVDQMAAMAADRQLRQRGDDAKQETNGRHTRDHRAPQRYRTGANEYTHPTRFTKFDFPRFQRHNIRVWLDQCERFFEIKGTPDNWKVRMARENLDEKGYIWHLAYMEEQGRDVHWAQYKRALRLRFGPPCVSPMADVKRLYQTGSLGGYKDDYKKGQDSYMEGVCCSPSDLQTLSIPKSSVMESVSSFPASPLSVSTLSTAVVSDCVISKNGCILKRTEDIVSQVGDCHEPSLVGLNTTRLCVPPLSSSDVSILTRNGPELSFGDNEHSGTTTFGDVSGFIDDSHNSRMREDVKITSVINGSSIFDFAKSSQEFLCHIDKCEHGKKTPSGSGSQLMTCTSIFFLSDPNSTVQLISSTISWYNGLQLANTSFKPQEHFEMTTLHECMGFVFQKLGPKLLLSRLLPNRPTRSFSNWVFLVVSAARCLVLSWFRGELMKMLYGSALHPLFTFGSENSKGVVTVCSGIQDRYLPDFKQ